MIQESQELAAVTFMSYNPTGLDSTLKCSFSNIVCEEYDVDFLAIQEHFKFSATTNQYFSKKFRDYYPYIIAAHRSPGQEHGRAKAGLAQLTRKGVQVKKERVSTYSFRVQAQILNLPASSVLWINIYLPTDPQLVGQYDDGVLREVLGEVEGILDNSSYDDVVWGSDLNWDMMRNTHFSRTMASFVEKTGLVSLWSSYPVPYTHVHTDHKSKSTIDHFLLSPRLLPLVSECGIVERGDNLSRHCPIWVKIRLGELPAKQQGRTWAPRKPCWSKATPTELESYTTRLQDTLLSTSIPESLWCADPHCTNTNHCQERDDLVLGILDSIVKTSHSCLPHQGGRWVGGKVKNQGRPVPGWLEDVEPYRKASLYWG